MTHEAVETSVSPNRLFAAADAILRAIDSAEGFASRVSMQTGPGRVGASLSVAVFTPDELIEAMAMLIRMGLVATQSPIRGVG